MSRMRAHELRKHHFPNGGTAPPADDAVPETLEKALEAYERHLRRSQVGPSSRKQYATVLRHDLGIPDGWPITRKVIERWRDEQVTLAETTQFSHWIIVNAFCRWLVRQYEYAGQEMADPMVDTPRPERPKPQPYKRTVTEDEVTALLRACNVRDWWDHRLWVMITLLRNTGLRIGEATKLRWRNIAWNKPLLSEAEITLEPVEEEERRAQKSKEADDFAHMTEPAFTVLRNWHQRLNHDGRGGPDQWVFPVTMGRDFNRPIRYRESHWSGHHVWEALVVLSVRARLTRTIYPHMFRHLAGTEFATRTGDLEATRLFMRHQDYKTVQGYLNTKRTREHMMAQHRKVAVG